MLIPLQAYQTSWQADFNVISARLYQCLGSLALRIDHIGSTSVPGLIAKPVIDIQVTVDALDFSSKVLASLQQNGFEFRGGNQLDRAPAWEDDTEQEWRKLYFRSSAGQLPRAQVHIRQARRRNQRYALLFRDFLRADDCARDAYGRFKTRVAEYVGHLSRPGGTGPYLDLKDPFIDVVMIAAERWATENDWQIK